MSISTSAITGHGQIMRLTKKIELKMKKSFLRGTRNRIATGASPMRSFFLSFFLPFLILFSLPLGAQESLTRIAVVDYQKLLLNGDKEGLALLEREAKKYSTNLQAMRNDINALESQKEGLLESGENNNLQRLEKELVKKKEAYNRYRQQSIADLDRKKKSLSTKTKGSAGAILDAIQYIARSQGFSLVLKDSDPNLIWWDFSVDITDEVLEELQS